MDTRAVILETCNGIRELLASLPAGTEIRPHQRVVETVQAKARLVLDEQLPEVGHELSALFRCLRFTEAADGGMILNSDRYERFLTKSLP
jgi:hypothetical protein